MKLGEFAELPGCPRRSDGRALPISSISDHLKGWEERVKQGPPEGKLQRPNMSFSFPIFTEHRSFIFLWEWGKGGGAIILFPFSSSLTFLPLFSSICRNGRE
jgi:hypothetical protein